MKLSDPLLNAWQKTLGRAKEQPAILDRDGHVRLTFFGVEQRACELESELKLFGPGSVIAIQIGNHEDWPSLFIACLRRRLIVLPLEKSINESQRDAALAVCNATAIASVVIPESAPEISRLRTGDAAPEWDGTPPVLLKLTSGTTAAPRAVRFRSHQLLADCDQICDTMGIGDADLNFAVIPISHSYGFSNLVTSLIARGVPMVLSSDRTPRAVLSDILSSGATVFPGMPVFYQAFCEMGDVPRLQKLRLCISAGAPLPVAVAKNFREKFNLAIHSFYGASECGGICYDREGTQEVEGYVGKAMTGVELEMLETDAPASRVRVRSAGVGDGYFPEADYEKLSNGMFVPDDLLKRHDSGFQISGRISDVINVTGKKVNPAEVEAHLLRVDGVREAVVFGRRAGAGLRNEEVAACVVASPHVHEGDLLRFCRQGLSAWQVPKRVFLVEAIPVNERGKISRRELARRFSGPITSSSLPTLGA
jgi:acyl-CoA synthetase (AMP-forming)/AMP-acid ligase II